MTITFVVSTGRSGSTMLSRILHLHPEVLSMSEFFVSLQRVPLSWELPSKEMDGGEVWRMLAEPDPIVDGMIAGGLRNDEMFYPYDSGRFSPATGIPNILHNTLSILTADPDALYDELAARVPDWPARPAAGQFRALFSLLAELLGRRVVVERSGSSLAMISEIKEQFPRSRFVHMYRDGVDCALSMTRHPMFRLAALLYLLAEEAGLPASASPAQIAAVLPEATGLILPPFDAGRFMAYDISPRLFATTWSSMVSNGIAALRELPAQSAIQLCYEQLLADPHAELRRLAGFIGVPPLEEWLRSATRLIDPLHVGVAASALDPELLAQLRADCEPGDRAIASFGTITR